MPRKGALVPFSKGQQDLRREHPLLLLAVHVPPAELHRPVYLKEPEAVAGEAVPARLCGDISAAFNPAPARGGVGDAYVKLALHGGDVDPHKALLLVRKAQAGLQGVVQKVS